MAESPSFEHRRRAEDDERAQSIACAVLTVSDTRTLETDRSGARVVELLEADGHVAARRDLVPDDPARIAAALDGWLDDPAVPVVLSTGGTGIGRRDTTVEVVRARLTAELEGFGELFRMVSYEEIGAAAMLSRAVAGLVVRRAAETFVFAMPGSTNAVETAMTRLVLPELRHLVSERR